jgi:hypothetical protein
MRLSTVLSLIELICVFVAAPIGLSKRSALSVPSPMYFVSSVVVKREREYVSHIFACQSGDVLKPPKAPTGPLWPL